MVDPKFFQFVASMAHLFCGMCLFLIVTMFWGLDPLIYVGPAFVGLTALKEFWYDANYEDLATRGSNLLDFSMYNLGALLGLCLYLLKINVI